MTPRKRSKILSILALAVTLDALASGASRAPNTQPEWSAHESGSASMHYSPLTQIDRSNVQSLAVAWTHDLQETDVSAEPLVLEDRLIVVSRDGDLVALDAASGSEIWRTRTDADLRRIRGFSFWRSKDGSEARVIFAANNRLRAVDPTNGRLVSSFDVDLRQGLGRDPARIRSIGPTTPGRVFEDLIIVGSITGENYNDAPGDVRAYDILTGKLAWAFHTIPHPGEPGHETWPADAWRTAGGANVWGGLSVDEARGIAYVVTGSATYDFFGADRAGDNLYANSIIALDARTGKRLWHFQTVHHDLWDYDLTASPVLVTITRDGMAVPAVAVAGKTGFLYVFNRVTGEPIWPIIERRVPVSDMPGERASPTQPFPTVVPPFARQSFTETDIDPELPANERKAVVERLRKARNEGMFTPPGLGETVQMPGSQGGANWGHAGGDPTGRVFVLSYDIVAMLQLTSGFPTEMLALLARTRGRGAAVYAERCQLCHGEPGTDGPSAAPSLTKITERISIADLRAIIRNGRGSMPAFSDLSTTDLGALIGYLGPNRTPVVPVEPSEKTAARPSDPTRYRSGFGYVLSKAGQSVIKPPWQTLSAYDLNSGRLLWQTPVGVARGRTQPTGMSFSKGSFAITGGGLVFVSSEADRKLHAYDVDTGRELWSGDLPSRPRGNPVVYAVNGRQYIVVPVANGGGITFSEIPDRPEDRGRNAYVAFALPASE